MSETRDDGLVPEGFDLAEARRAPSTTDPDDRRACPECGSTQTSRNKQDGRGRTTEAEFSCDVCHAGFDQEDLREATDE